MTDDGREVAGAVIVAAGRSRRMDGDDKLWAPIEGSRPLLAYSLSAFQACAAIERIVLVVAEEAIERAQALAGKAKLDKVCAVVPGGERRQHSVRAGLEALECTWIAVHDGARPLVTPDLIERGLDAARETGAACCALPAPDTVKEADGGVVARTLDRSRLWLAQTPQVFRRELLLRAHEQARGDATDDAALVEALGVKVRLYPGSARNLKVTTQDDLALVRALVAAG